MSTPHALLARIAGLSGRIDTHPLPRTAHRVSPTLAHVHSHTDPVSRSRALEEVLCAGPPSVTETRPGAVRQFHSLALSEPAFLMWALMSGPQRQAALNLALAHLDGEIQHGRYELITTQREDYAVPGMTAGPGLVVVRAAGRRRGPGPDILAWPIAGWRPGRHARPQDLGGEPLWELLEHDLSTALFRAPTQHDAVAAMLAAQITPEDPRLLLRVT
ncbi:hypothetical protein [Deinococcus marmoris]|uniref:hypothetical protein n=1 Tax=Deinococcus marmoris TaxID=249408 RepID=UPI0012DE8A50|nr:hypothetical protein [Deinococcus marmoris]